MEPIIAGFRQLLDWVIGLGGLIAVAFFIWGGFKYMGARDDPKAVVGAKQTLMHALIGLIIVVSSYGLVEFALGLMCPQCEPPDPAPVLEASVVAVRHSGSSQSDGRIVIEFDNYVCVVGGKTKELVVITSRGNAELVHPAAQTRRPCATNSQSKELKFQIPATGTNIVVNSLGKTNSAIEVVTPTGNLARTKFSRTSVCVGTCP